MSDTRPEQEPDHYRATPDPADEPTTGPPAGASAASTPSPAASATRGATSRDSGIDAVTGSTQDADQDREHGTDQDREHDADQDRAHDTGHDPDAAPAGPEPDLKARRRRRLFIGGIAAGAALIVIALCAGGLAVISAVSSFRNNTEDVREDRRLRDSACIALETRLNRLTPPGATLTPQARAVAVRDENAAARIYVTQLVGGKRSADNWRQLIDARAAFADALDAQAKTRTPAFYVAPATGDGRTVTDELARQSPGACAGSIRRLAAPEL